VNPFNGEDVRARDVASCAETGMMFINNINWINPKLPLGGTKDSGSGCALGDRRIQAFINKKRGRFAKLDVPG
jgi:succinate-semialdehyde dehydrogenase/glutarate-semialdehyde dehydrogenase